MSKQLPIPLFLFSSGDKTEQAFIRKLKKQKLIFSLGPRLYTSLPKEKIELAVRQSWAQIVSTLFPHALLSHRSALEYKPSPQNEVFLTASTNRDLHYPGLTIKLIRGPKALSDDVDFMFMKASSMERALLENLTINRGKTKKNLSQEFLEKKLEQILTLKGEAELNKVRDRARSISKKLKLEKEFIKLNQIIGALLGTKSSQVLKTDLAKARAGGLPFDMACFERLEILFAELRHLPLPEIKEKFSSANHFKNKAFFESYFSNHIEGTVFEIAEAEKIIFDKKIPQNRPEDAHDILGTFNIISNPNEIKVTPNSAEDLKILLKKRHFTLLQNRADVGAGSFKTKPNRAGNTLFTLPELVEGSLEKGFELYKSLPKGLARAVFMMFLVAEVHPFYDGNGRIARVMMNAELVAQNLVTIIIPNVYREDYLLALRAMSRRHRASPFIEMLVLAQDFSNFDFSNYPKSLNFLKSHYWFEEPDEAKILL